MMSLWKKRRVVKTGMPTQRSSPPARAIMSEETDISDTSKSAKRSWRQNISDGCRMVGTSSMPSGCTVPSRIGHVLGLDAMARLSWSFMRAFKPSGVRRGRRRAGCLIAAGLDHFHDGAVGGAEAQRRRAGLREDLPAVLFDDVDERLAVGDFEAPVMNARPGTGEHRVLAVVAVPLHQCDVEIAVSQVARDMVAVRRGVELLEAEDLL